jgi:adenosine kinase
MLEAQDLIQGIDGCRILISNDYELDLIMSKTQLKKDDLLKRARAIIVTLGALGSKIFTPDAEIRLPAVRPKKVEDPTGAGDAYRGGLLSGLAGGRDMEHSARMGSVCASFAVECYGTQEYKFTREEFNARFKECFGADPWII